MSNRADVDYQTRLAHRAQFVKNVADAKAQVLIAEKNLIVAEAALADYSKKESK